MLTIGLTGWGDHVTIQHNRGRKLEDYSGHFPLVELDTSFYAIPSEKNIEQWLLKTPASFSFIPKAYSVLTLHKEFHDEFPTMADAFDAFIHAFTPMLDAGKVKSFLFQFPPTFDCVKKHVHYLRFVRKHMGDLPISVEFRNQSWFTEETRDQTLQFLNAHDFTHVVVDQPQTPNNSVPKVVESTSEHFSFIRLHGRNYEGWLGEDVTDWRAERTLYNYSSKELDEIKSWVLELNKHSKEVCIIFNNNSGGHAAPNAKSLQEKLGLTFEGLGPQQLDLF